MSGHPEQDGKSLRAVDIVVGHENSAGADLPGRNILRHLLPHGHLGPLRPQKIYPALEEQPAKVVRKCSPLTENLSVEHRTRERAPTRLAPRARVTDERRSGRTHFV